ncbi:MAG: biopolymer transporter ExbD [Bacteroidota bacterium]|jgi:biopolymer transport protein ExbD
MGRFKKEGSKETPQINTGSMSDIIFMFLFFFMVITKMRENTLFVKVNPPQATEVQKLEKKSLVSSIYIGAPMKAEQYGSEPRIQLNDQFAEPSDIQEFIAKEKQSKNEEDRPFLTTSLKVDLDVKMGIVTDVKQELRLANAFKISYATRKKLR